MALADRAVDHARRGRPVDDGLARVPVFLGRAGGVEALEIAAETVAPVAVGGELVSSSRIREALAAGDPGTATRLLTRAFAIEGEVQRGDERGRALGWPTANLVMGEYQRAAYGIYAVRVRLDADGPDGGSEWPGVASLGIRPMFEPAQELLEAHLFGFEGDLYGRTIEVALHHYIRPEAKFDSVEALTARMAEDAAEAKRLLALPQAEQIAPVRSS